jgi:ribulose-bisphosphate carboxylase large chain
VSVSPADAILITYAISGPDPLGTAEAIRVEQTIEFPFELAPTWIQEQVVGSIVETNGSEITIAYNPDVTGGDVVQFLNLLWGNVSLFTGVRVVDIAIPDSVLASFPGPRFGVEGLREIFGAPTRPLLCTALKPMGLSAHDLAGYARTLAEAGFDIIKDDHGLANQPWAPWEERIAVVSETVRQVAETTGHRSVYMPTLNVPADRIVDAAHQAKQAGAGALLLLPGVTGFDTMRALAMDEDLALPIMSHPSFLGSHVVNQGQGISHGLLIGMINRLAGADLCIFPNYGGRFSFSPEECRDIQVRCSETVGSIRPSWPSPGGGMTLDRIDEMITFYGNDVTLLIGGALHRGDLGDNARAMVRAVSGR